jgi:hypothetical protein
VNDLHSRSEVGLQRRRLTVASPRHFCRPDSSGCCGATTTRRASRAMARC